jgi:hypothetical protein
MVDIKESPEYLVIEGKKIKCQIREVNIFELEYYLENPRVNSVISSIPNISQEIIEEKLWELPSVKDLYQDIKDNKGLIDEILVLDKVVLEGNSRLCAYRYLYKNSPDEEKQFWLRIRCKIILEPVSKKDIHTILCTYHIKRKKDWDTYEKASYMAKMLDIDDMKPEEIAKLTNLSPLDVMNHIKAYKKMRSEGMEKDLDKFSYYLEFYKKKLDKDEEISKNFTKLIKDNRIPEARWVRQLAKIAKDKKAKKRYLDQEDDAVSAFKRVSKSHPEEVESFYKKLKELTEILDYSKPEIIIEEIKSCGSKKSIIERFVRSVKRFSRTVNIDYHK